MAASPQGSRPPNKDVSSCGPAEVSLASYILARQNGAPLTAVPTIPRRLFSQNHIFVSADAGIAAPQDLAGRSRP